MHTLVRACTCTHYNVLEYFVCIRFYYWNDLCFVKIPFTMDSVEIFKKYYQCTVLLERIEIHNQNVQCDKG